MAQLVIAAAGAAIGGALAPAGFALLGMSGAQLGWMAGSMLGSLANKPPSQHGPRLDDSALRVTGTEYGQTIPWVAGAPRLPGQMIWASDRRETATTEEVGKGGGAEYTTYSYDIDVLYLVADRPGCTVTRIWLNGRVVWTTLESSDDESRLASEGVGVFGGLINAVASTARTERWSRLTVYDGRADQLPDPTYEAAVTDAPAYRGRTTVFIEGLQLGSTGALPNFTFEVASDAGESDDIVRRYAVTDIGSTSRYRYSHVGGLGVPFIRRMLPSLAVESYAPSPSIGGRRGATIKGEFGPWPAGYGVATVGDWNGWELNLYEATTFSHPVALIDGQAVRLQRFWHQTSTGAGASNIILSIGSTAPGVISGGVDLTAVLPSGLYLGAVFPCSDGEHLLICTAAATTGGTGELCDAWWLVKRSGGVTTLVDSGVIDMTGSFALSLGTSVYGHGSFTGYGSGSLEDDLSHIWWAYGAGQLHVVMGTIGEDGVLRLADVLNGGDGIPGGSFSSFSATSCWAESGYCVVVAGGTYSAFRRAGTTIHEVPLRRVVEELCDRAAMPAGTYDASALDAIARPVRALAIPQVSSARATLDMLMTSHAFHAALSDKLYFLPRSTVVEADLVWEQLGAGDEQAADDPLEITIGSDLELPARVAVQYRNMSGDQQTGTEYSDRVLDSGQASVQTVQLAMGLLPAEAKGIADVISADTQAALVSAPVSTTLRHAKLWAGSVVQVQAWNGSIYRMRVQRREDSGGVLRFELVADDPQALVSQQVTDGQYVVIDTVRSLDGTAFEVLDIPILRDDDDSLGYYVAARSQASGRWPGAVVQASRDGVAFSNVATVAEQAVFGSATTVLPAWVGGPVMDEVSALEVSIGDGQLSSVTRDQLLADASANALLVGSEIIRFVSAQLLSTGPNVYRLTRLLRGQRGTEWAMAGHGAGERVVLLRARGMRRVAAQAGDLAVAQQVRAATLGTVASDAAAEPFTLVGFGTKPFSPVNLRKAAGGGGIALTWERRTRRSVVIRDGVGIQVPLGEASEAYDVEVFDAGNALIETQRVTAPSATLGAPVFLRAWPRDAADLVAHGGYIYGRNSLGSGGVQRYGAARALVAELATVNSYGDSTTKVARMVHDGAGTAYLLLTGQLTTGGGIAALKVLKLDLATLAVTGSCDVYASAQAAYTSLHYYSGAVYVAGSDGAGSTVLARVVASSMTFSTSVTISGVGGYAIADDGAGSVCMVAAGQYRPYNATTLAAGTPVALGVSVYADQLRLVGSVLWGYGTGGIVAIASPAGTLVQHHALSCIAGSPIALDGSTVVMQERRVLSAPGTTTTLPGDVLRFNGGTGALQSRVPFADRYLTGIVDGNYIASVSSAGAYAAAEYGAPGTMSGGRAVVYQISATVGRGYPAEITL